MKLERQNKVTIAVVLVIAVVVIASLVFYQSYKTNKNFFEYNGFTIYDGDNNGLKMYQIKFFLEGNSGQPFVINSRYNPNELENIAIYSDIKRDLIKDELYVTMDGKLSGKATIAFAEIDKYMENPFLFNLPTYPALLEDLGNDLPVISCENVSESIGVIMFKVGEKNEIYSDDGCVIMEAINEDELIKVADRLSLTALGVIKS